MVKKTVKTKCVSCGKRYDQKRYPNGCPACQSTRLNATLGRKTGGNGLTTRSIMNAGDASAHLRQLGYTDIAVRPSSSLGIKARVFLAEFTASKNGVRVTGRVMSNKGTMSIMGERLV